MILRSHKRPHTGAEAFFSAHSLSDVSIKGKKIRKNNNQDKPGKTCLSTMDNPITKVTPSGNKQRTISLRPSTAKLLQSPPQVTNRKETNPIIQNKEQPVCYKCQKISAPNIRGSQETIMTGYIDPALIEGINREIEAMGFPHHKKITRQGNATVNLLPRWESYLAKQPSSQATYMCHGDAGLIRSWEIPMPAEEPDREILAASHETIITLVNDLHTHNPDIKHYFGQNALRLTSINFYYHQSENPENNSLPQSNHCLGWHVDKGKVGQLVACINLAGKRTLTIRHNDKLVTIESNEPGHFYLMDATQFEHAVQLIDADNSMALILRSPYPELPQGSATSDFFANTDIFLPTAKSIIRA
ncbi:hypothetical protein [Endozoicomonas sp. YOMI1]|uniref:hypothetical protein n=1 Tax=Endozoicomonas sp. YOMI1 TaxID=2828739 RepID=UPI0021476FB2|nr:hypothetical protein [Endozoicomonas sp. YOMI1]